MLQDKIDWLQRDFDRFKVNFQNELTLIGLLKVTILIYLVYL